MYSTAATSGLSLPYTSSPRHAGRRMTSAYISPRRSYRTRIRGHECYQHTPARTPSLSSVGTEGFPKDPGNEGVVFVQLRVVTMSLCPNNNIDFKGSLLGDLQNMSFYCLSAHVTNLAPAVQSLTTPERKAGHTDKYKQSNVRPWVTRSSTSARA